MKLESFKDKKVTKRKMILLSLGVITIVGVSLLLYKTFASFSSEVSFPLMSGKVNYYGNADIIFAFYNGETKLDEMPQKGNPENLEFEKAVCNNGASIEWDEENWAPLVVNLLDTKTTCELYFSDSVVHEVELDLTLCENIITATINTNYSDGRYATMYEYRLDEKEWFEGEDTWIFRRLSPGEHKVTIKVTDSEDQVKEISKSVNVEFVEPVTVELLGKEITLAENEDGLYRVSHCNYNGEEIEMFNSEEYRYAGSNYVDDDTPYVHNYIEFNNEKWQIIGLVNTYYGEQGLKIIRRSMESQTSFDNFSWDANGSDYDAEDISNWYDHSTLKSLLNGIYYNSEVGECEHGECDFTGNGDLPKGLDDTAKEMMSRDISWFVPSYYVPGGVSNGQPDHIYEAEKYYDYSLIWGEFLDYEYNGVGLMYANDFAYAGIDGTFEREKCLNNYLIDWEYDFYECNEQNWLNPSYSCVWTISKVSYENHVVSIPLSGRRPTDKCEVWPVVYLSPSVEIYDGDGSFNSPYKIRISDWF